MPGNFKKNLISDLFINTAEEIMCLDSDDDEIDEIIERMEDNLEIIFSCRYGIQRHVPKNELWFSRVLANYDDDRLRGMLRVSRSQFFIILELIKDNPVFNGKRCSLQHTVFFQLSIVLYRLGASGEGASASRIAALFAIGDGDTLQRITKRVFRAILDLKDCFLQWPNAEQQKKLVSETMHELPHCFGYLDGCEIPLYEAPSLDPTSFFSRKKNYSMKFQAVCDCNLNFIHICVGFPGSVHDARIYANSSLGRNTESFFSDDRHWLAADSAYRLTAHTITPYRNALNTESWKAQFNKKFSKYRVRIEHSFGILKEKFNSLKSLRINIKDTESHKFACSWITVCCILHNILLPHWENYDFELYDREKDTNFEINDENEERRNDFLNDLDNVGEHKREALCSIILEQS